MSDTKEKSRKGPDLSIEVFGGVLDYDGAGLYPGLELLNLVFGSEEIELLPTVEVVRIRRKAHDFARRMVWDETFVNDASKSEVLFDEETEDTVSHLLSCLQLPIPNMVKAPGWDRAHFFPYTKSLIHWDARLRAGGVRIERRYFRGGGALAFHILRKDPDQDRLQRCRNGFSALFSENENSALERLSKTLLQHGFSDSELGEDRLEARSKLKGDDHEELLREGIVNILEHTEVSGVTRIRSILTWVAFWLVLIQKSRSAAYLGRNSIAIICDCGARHVQLRRASQRCLKDTQTLIVDAISKSSEGASISKQQLNKIRSFFWATAASINLLNAWKGRKHFTLGLNLLETFVLTSTSGATEIPFEVFVHKWLYEKCGLVVGRDAAESGGQLTSFDVSVFEDNENQLALQMKAAGLLAEYSDATRMIGTGGLL
tara:strand:+ start:3145 stop:4437 length:1293 start_codon:yes stop_codon:yes gene_type:complete